MYVHFVLGLCCAVLFLKSELSGCCQHNTCGNQIDPENSRWADHFFGPITDKNFEPCCGLNRVVPPKHTLCWFAQYN